jgi:biotin carboxyl carrier protein
VQINGTQAVVNGQSYTFDAAASTASAAVPAQSSGKGETVTTPLPGLILRIEKKVGDYVKEGETIIVIESMKMETPLNAPTAGRIQVINVQPQQQVQAGTVVTIVG